MTSTRKLLAGAIVAAALVAAGSFGPASAQPAGYGPANCAQGGPGMMGPGYGLHHGAMGHGSGAGRGQMRHGMWSNPAAGVEGYLAALKVELKITPDQDRAWQAFTTKAKQQAESMIARREQMFAQASATNQSAPDRLAQRAEFAKQGAARMETMAAAVKDLYATLTPEQQTIADQHLARGPMGGAGGRGFRR